MDGDDDKAPFVVVGLRERIPASSPSSKLGFPFRSKLVWEFVRRVSVGRLGDPSSVAVAIEFSC